MNSTPSHRASNSEGNDIPSQEAARSERLRLLTAFALVYIIWGSTYLAIHYAIESLPPFVMLSARYAAAGMILYAIMRLRGVPAPNARDWRAAFIVGALLIAIGNGAAAWAIRTVPTGITALVIAMSPLWMVLIDWVRPGGVRPSLRVAAGIIAGLCGIALLLEPGSVKGGLTVEGLIVLFAGTLSWASGSIYSRVHLRHTNPLLATAMQMITGSVLLAIAAAVTGQWSEVELAAVTTRSALALTYLIVFGSIVAYSAYGWLLQHTTTARASTYAYVNPVVALVLGSVLADEVLSMRTIGAAVIIIGSVVAISISRGNSQKPTERKSA